MTFDMTTLITDRTAADVERVKYLRGRINAGTATAAEKAEWGTALKGAYNASDLNRVSDAAAYLAARLTSLGNAVPGYERTEIKRTTSRLPEGYTELEYIESTGTQYVNTEFQPNQDTTMVCDAQFTSVTGTISFGGQRLSSGTQAFVWIAVSGNLRSYYKNGYTVVATADTVRHVYAKEKNETLIDGTLLHSATYAAFSGNHPIFLFASNDSGSAAYLSSAKIYSCQIYDDETLVRDYVPCKNASGEAGLYDLTNEAFYGNAGTGSFTAGPEVASDSDAEELDPYTWYESDTPTGGELAAYLANVEAVRRVLHQAAGTPATPESMANLTVDTANDIEKILAATDRLATNVSRAWYFSGEVCAGEV